MLYEKYRPQTFEGVLGQDRAIRAIRLVGKSGYGGKAFWISGPSGTGAPERSLATRAYPAG